MAASSVLLWPAPVRSHSSSRVRVMFPLACLLLQPAVALRVGFAMETSSWLIPIQEFGASGGSVNVSLALSPTPCSTAQETLTQEAYGTSMCFDGLEQLYLAMFTFDQARNLTARLEGYSGSSSRSPLNCDGFPAVGWTSLSLIGWEEAAVAADGAALFDVGGASTAGEEPVPAPRPPRQPDGVEPIRFSIRYELPASHDLYTLSLYNCRGASVSVRGEARFVGGGGEQLSSLQRDVLAVRPPPRRPQAAGVCAPPSIIMPPAARACAG